MQWHLLCQMIKANLTSQFRSPLTEFYFNCPCLSWAVCQSFSAVTEGFWATWTGYCFFFSCTFLLVLVCSTYWERTPGLKTGPPEREVKLHLGCLISWIHSSKKDAAHNYITEKYNKKKHCLQIFSKSQ